MNAVERVYGVCRVNRGTSFSRQGQGAKSFTTEDAENFSNYNTLHFIWIICNYSGILG